MRQSDAGCVVAAVTALALIGVSCSGQPERSSTGARATATAVARGEETFYAKCAVCHEARPGTPGTGSSLKGIFQQPPHRLADGMEIDGSEKSIREIILRGNRNMPPMDTALSPQELEDVLAYLHAL
jgi:mono/diheme cytochrome c family protein